ncbi:F0F1 ATP synthase subunit B [Helicobacter ibis]|uniref:ATP synthase subunit b n=1 Tax=Helicobacter ibis TaxID=2962633 RepID=A0ABT4VD32_9HELI|nr:F0F1 ATP synthase subunit B [Helicobacter ibis]MDA3968614.1 F0F1 ATP synthase subunit B [Helicobacter ibis]
MNSIIRILSLFFIPTFLLAAGSGEVDIVERSINFVIFFALIYYFAADKVKTMFVERRNSIAESLSKIQDKLQESKKEKQKALKQLEEAKKTANDIIETAKKEALIIAQKVDEQTNEEIESLVRQFNDDIAFERKKIERSVVADTLEEFLNSDLLTLNKETLVRTLLKKVA